MFCVISDGICGNSGGGGDDGDGGGDDGDDGGDGGDDGGDDDSSGDVSRRQRRDWQQVDLLQKALLLL